jgi:hypothetical protein
MAGSFREGAEPGDAHRGPPPTPTPPLSQYISLDFPACGGPTPSSSSTGATPELRRALVSDDQADELKRIRASVQDSTGKAEYAPALSPPVPLPLPHY